MIKYINIEKFIKEQKEGQVFCKISKSPDYSGKGSNVDYKKIKGHILYESKGDMTFGSLEAMLNHLNYGNRLTIIEFDEHDIEELKDAEITNNIMNKYCYDTNKYKIGKSMSLKEFQTYDYIFNNVKNIDLMEKTLKENYNNIITKIRGYGGTNEVEKYFKQKVHEFFQKESIPEKLIQIFDTKYINRLVLFKIFNALKQKNINLYIKDRSMKVYSNINEHENEIIMQELLIDINRNYKRKFFVDNNDFKRADIIKNCIINSNILNRLIYKFL